MLHITDHQDRAVARLIEQYRSKVTYPKVVRLLSAEHQVLEDEFWALYDETLDTAEGEQLKVWGRMVGLARDASWDDASFRAWIRIRSILLVAGATGDIIIQVFQAVLSDDVTVQLQEDFPAALLVRLGGVGPVLRWSVGLEDVMPGELVVPLAFGDVVAAPGFLAQLLGACKAAGVRGIVEWINSPLADVFTLNAGPGLGVGKLAGGVLVT